MVTVTKTEHSVEKPLNREPDLDKLISSYLTTSEPYDRNHGPILHIDPSTHMVAVDGCVKENITLSVDDLKALPQYEVIAALQCAGNRRHDMRTLLKEVEGVDWFDGAVMNCKWRGPKLIDVLAKAGVDEKLMKADDGSWKGHVAFACHETQVQDDTWYGGSISLERAMMEDADVVLALEMNGEPLTPKHGAPVRALVPGIAGARSVKWLTRITVQAEESSNHYQRHDYKILPPEVTDMEQAEEYWAKVEALMDMPINSVIGLPSDESTVHRDETGSVQCKGYALPHGMDGPVTKVEVSGDDGETWHEAELDHGEQRTSNDRQKFRWAWCLWSAKIPMKPGKGQQITCRATDFGGNVQPRDNTWNLRGVGYNACDVARDLEII